MPIELSSQSSSKSPDDIKTLYLRFREESNVVLKFNLAVCIYLNEFNQLELQQEAKVKDKAKDKTGVMQDDTSGLYAEIKDFFNLFIKPNNFCIAPDGYFHPSRHINRSILYFYNDKEKYSERLPDELKMGKKEALSTSRSEHLLVWRKLGNERTVKTLSEFSLEDTDSYKVLDEVRQISRRCLDSISDIVKQYLTSKSSPELTHKIEQLLLSIGGSEDKHRIWSYQRVLTALLLDLHYKIDLSTCSAVDVICLFLYIKQLGCSPAIVFSFFDFVVHFDYKVLPKGRLPELIHLSSLLWYMAAQVLFELAIDHYEKYAHEIQRHKLDETKARYFFLAVAIFCSHKAKLSDHHFIKKIVQDIEPRVASAMEIISSECLYIAKVLEFLQYVESDALRLNPEICFDDRTGSVYKISKNKLMSLYRYYIKYLEHEIKLPVSGLLGDTLTSYYKSVALSRRQGTQILELTEQFNEISGLKSELDESHAKLTSEYQHISEQHLESIHESKQLAIRNQELLTKTRQQEVTISKIADANARIKVTVQSTLDKLYEKLEALDKSYFEKMTDISRELLASISSLLTEQHITLYNSKDYLQQDFNLLFLNYVRFIYKLYNSLFKNLLAVSSPLNLKTDIKRYIASLNNKLLCYSKAKDILDRLAVHEPGLELEHIGLQRLNNLYLYLMGIGSSLEQNKSQLYLVNELKQTCEFMINFGQLLRNYKLTVYSDVTLSDVSTSILTSAAPSLTTPRL